MDETKEENRLHDLLENLQEEFDKFKELETVMNDIGFYDEYSRYMKTARDCIDSIQKYEEIFNRLNLI